MNDARTRPEVLFLVLIFILSAGCIKYLPHNSSGDTTLQTLPGDTPVPTPEPTVINTPLPSDSLPSQQPPANVTSLVPATTLETISVKEVNPDPYITPDPYRLAYRNLSNRYTDSNLVPNDLAPRIPQFTRNIVLRSNSTAFQVNVTKGPLIIDMKYSPLFANPDKTSLEGTNSFVYSNAEVTVFSNGLPVARDGYNGVYSIETEKKITIYSTGSYVITITGNFIDVTMAIITGSAPEPATPVPTVNWEEN